MPRQVKAAGNHGGRKRKKLTAKEWESVNYMCMIHCTGEEIAGVIGIDYDTLNKNCKEKFNIPMSEYIKQHQCGGKMSLRRAQWKAAESGNVSMLIWLGKQWLEQKEQQEITIANDDESIQAMNKFFEEKRNEERK